MKVDFAFDMYDKVRVQCSGRVGTVIGLKIDEDGTESARVSTRLDCDGGALNMTWFPVGDLECRRKPLSMEVTVDVSIQVNEILRKAFGNCAGCGTPTRIDGADAQCDTYLLSPCGCTTNNTAWIAGARLLATIEAATA